MNETIVKTEKLTELKNLVSEIEKLEKENNSKSQLDEEFWLNVSSMHLKQIRINELIKKL